MLAPFLVGAGLAGEMMIGTSYVGFSLNVTKTIVFGISPLLTNELMVTGVLIGLCTMPSYVGRWLVRNSVRVHSQFMEVFIVWRPFVSLRGPSKLGLIHERSSNTTGEYTPLLDRASVAKVYVMA